MKPTNDSWRVDETYIEIKGEWKYLYRAVDSEGNMLGFLLSAKRDGKAAARFFRKLLKYEIFERRWSAFSQKFHIWIKQQ